MGTSPSGRGKGGTIEPIQSTAHHRPTTENPAKSENPRQAGGIHQSGYGNTLTKAIHDGVNVLTDVQT